MVRAQLDPPKASNGWHIDWLEPSSARRLMRSTLRCVSGRQRSNAQAIDDQRGISSAGRAPALQAGGRRFDPVILHQYFRSDNLSIQHQSGFARDCFVVDSGFPDQRGCSLKIHRVENQRCWWKLHIRKGLVQTVPPATYLIASKRMKLCDKHFLFSNDEYSSSL